MVGTALPARGQSITSPYDFIEHSQSVRAFGSYVVTDRGVIGIGPGSAYGFGMGYNIRISGPFTLDVRGTFIPTTRTAYNVTAADSADLAADPTLGLVPLGEADLSILALDAALRFDITGPRTWYRLQPFALIGVGGVIRLASDNAVEEALPEESDLRVRFQNGFTGNVGGGIEWHATERFTLVAEARDVLWKVHVPQGFFVPGRLIDDDEWVQTGHFSLGLNFRF